MLSMSHPISSSRTPCSRPRNAAREARGVEGQVKGVSVAAPPDEAVESDKADGGRENRSMPVIPVVNDSQHCEDQPPREAGVGLLASGQARRSSSLEEAVRVVPDGTVATRLTSPARAGEDSVSPHCPGCRVDVQ